MTSNLCLILEKPQPGQGRWKNSDRCWILESFSDSDWSSNQSHRRSPGSGMHMFNGYFLFGSSRTQKIISLMLNCMRWYQLCAMGFFCEDAWCF
jgi:hypothetical protein